MDGDNKNLASLHARATRALELSKESLASCIVTATHIEQGISKLIESHERLEPIKALLQENEKEVTEQKKSIDIKAKIGPEAERLFAQQKEILTSYQRALNILRSKRLHPQIAPFIPLDLPENEVTGTLGDWANTPELERLEDEALQELLLLEQVFRWVESAVSRTETKFATLAEITTKWHEATKDYRLENPEIRIQQMQADLVTAKEIVREVEAIAAKSTPGSSDALSTSPSSMPSANMLILSQSVENLPDKIARLQQITQKLLNLRSDIDTRAAAYSNAFMQCTTATNVYQMFAVESNTLLSEFQYLDTEFELYKQNARSNVFQVLKTSSDAWERFVAAADELAIEVARRRRETLRKQEIIEAYQRELDELYNSEMKERKRFEDNYLKDCPQTWAQSPLLLELPPRYKIIPEKYTTALPDLGDDFIRRPASQYGENSLFRSLRAGEPGVIAGSMASTTIPAGLPGPPIHDHANPSLEASSLYMSTKDFDDPRIAEILLEQSSDDSVESFPGDYLPQQSFGASPPSGAPHLHQHSVGTQLQPLNP